MNDRAVIIAGLVALTCTCAIAILERGPAIQRAVRVQAEEALKGRPLEVRVDGRTVSVSGTAGSENEKAAITGRLEALTAVHKVQNRVFVVAPETLRPGTQERPVDYNYTLSVRDLGGEVDVSGNVPNELSRERIMTIVYTASIGKQVSAQWLNVAGVESPRAAAWDEAARKSLQIAVALEQLVFELRDDTLAIEGLAEDDAHRTTLLNDLSPFSGQRRFKIDVGMSGADLCQEQIHRLLSQSPIIFSEEGASLTSQSTTVLDQVLDVLWQCPSANIEFVDLDNSGSREQSLQRLQAVRGYLIAEGILATRMPNEPISKPSIADSNSPTATITIRIGHRSS